MATDEAVGIVPVSKEGEEFLFCLVQHADGHWGFPKGHRDAGESDQQTARRELQEETGIGDVAIVSNKQYAERYSFEANGIRYNKTVIYFLGLVQNRSNTTPAEFKDEIPDMRWLPYHAMLRTLTYVEGKKEMLSDIWEYLKNRLE